MAKLVGNFFRARSSPLFQGRRKIDRFGILRADLPAADRFSDEVLGASGYDRVMDVGVAIGYGSANHGALWILAAPDATPVEVPAREMHLPFTAPDSHSVRAFSSVATGLGAVVARFPAVAEVPRALLRRVRARPTATTSQP